MKKKAPQAPDIAGLSDRSGLAAARGRANALLAIGFSSLALLAVLATLLLVGLVNLGRALLLGILLVALLASIVAAFIGRAFVG